MGRKANFTRGVYDDLASLLPPDQLKVVAKAWDIQKAGNYR